jgi:alkylhydroperoxidase family enzyme
VPLRRVEQPRDRPRRRVVRGVARVAHNCGSAYEWAHHERLGRAAGLTAEDVERVRSGPDAPGWTPRRALLLRAADELHATRDISDALWEQLSGEFRDERELIEICMLAGHYEMLAGALNALRVQPDAVAQGSRPALIRMAEVAMRRRRS